MAAPQASEFLKKLGKDADLRSQVRDAGDLAIERICEIAAKQGYEFTVDEMRATLQELWSGEADISFPDEDGSRTFVPVSERPGF